MRLRWWLELQAYVRTYRVGTCRGSISGRSWRGTWPGAAPWTPPRSRSSRSEPPPDLNNTTTLITNIFSNTLLLLHTYYILDILCQFFTLLVWLCTQKLRSRWCIKSFWWTNSDRRLPITRRKWYLILNAASQRPPKVGEHGGMKSNAIILFGC